MPKVAQELGPLDVKRLTHPGGKGNAMIAVGGVAGLYMQVTPKNGKTWVLRVLVGNKRRDIGLGGFPTVTLAQARDKAREARDMIARGVDPVEERKAAKARLILAQRRGMLSRMPLIKPLLRSWTPSRTRSIKTNGAARSKPTPFPTLARCLCRRSTPPPFCACCNRYGRRRPKPPLVSGAEN
jgi:hypothetical protein